MNVNQTIYVAALLEGEGSFMEKRPGSPRVSCQMTDRDIIGRLRELTGVGTICATTAQAAHHKPAWTWQIQAKHDAAMVMLAVFPYMGHRRQRKILEILSRYQGV